LSDKKLVSFSGICRAIEAVAERRLMSIWEIIGQFVLDGTAGSMKIARVQN
jgi:hypothetical protein